MWNDPMDHYEVFLFERGRFHEPASLPTGFLFESGPPREAERDLLATEYSPWDVPYERAFPGGESASVLSVWWGDRIAGLIYLSDENELDLPRISQIHYPVVAHEFRSRGLYAPLLTSLLADAERRGRSGVLLVSDREGMSGIYERWGAQLVGELPRMNRLRRSFTRVSDPRRRIRSRILELTNLTPDMEF